jgi:hypothetical protein
VTAKPGLPLGRFQQRILLSTNLPSAAELDLPLSGTIVREISLAGDGWSDEDRVLNFGAVDGRVGARRKLVLVTRGPHAKETAFKIARVVPDFLKAEMISPRVAGGSEAVPAVLWLEVPPRDAPADYSGGDRGKLGEVVLETTNPNFRELQIRIRFLVKPTN